MRTENIRDTIVAARRRRLQARGHSQGLALPEKRTVPLVPFSFTPLLICEIKRRSPSRGEIDPGLDPVRRAKAYSQGGVRTFSVLTEEEFFGGSLSDLVAVKSAFPEATVLRKDFLMDPEDIEVSFRMGADAILLIASVLEKQRLEELYALATRLGLSVLLEVHSKEDVEKVRSLRPAWVGINARDLETFRTDLLHPLRVREWIDWEAKVVFESGVRVPEDGRFVGSAGFEGLLVGEAVVRDPAAVPRLRAAYEEGYEAEAGQKKRTGKQVRPSQSQFWVRITKALERKRPLVKICGITNPSDARLAVEAGADLLGFIFAPSPRKATPSLVREVRDLDVLKVGVVVAENDQGMSGVEWDEAVQLIEEGYLDALQVHAPGDIELSAVSSPVVLSAAPFYPVRNPRTAADVKVATEKTPGPRFLIDASKEGMYGGTGIRVTDEVLQAFREHGVPLWLAGGLRPESIREVVEKWNPELVDVSSGVEAYPGKKDPEKVRSFFKEIQNASTVIRK